MALLNAILSKIFGWIMQLVSLAFQQDDIMLESLRVLNSEKYTELQKFRAAVIFLFMQAIITMILVGVFFLGLIYTVMLSVVAALRWISSKSISMGKALSLPLLVLGIALSSAKPAYAWETAFLVGESQDGLYKICFYSSSGGTTSFTVPATKLCPLTMRLP